VFGQFAESWFLVGISLLAKNLSSTKLRKTGRMGKFPSRRYCLQGKSLHKFVLVLNLMAVGGQGRQGDVHR
jgi:hypothetical protein